MKMTKPITPAQKREKMRTMFAVSVVAMEIAQAFGKRRIKSRDTAIMYLNAAITELKHGDKADIGIVNAAWIESMRHMNKSVRRKKPKQFPSGGVFSNTPPGEHEFIVLPNKKAPL